MNAYSNILLDSAKVMEDNDDYKPHLQMDLRVKNKVNFEATLIKGP